MKRRFKPKLFVCIRWWLLIILWRFIFRYHLLFDNFVMHTEAAYGFGHMRCMYVLNWQCVDTWPVFGVCMHACIHRTTRGKITFLRLNLVSFYCAVNFFALFMHIIHTYTHSFAHWILSWFMPFASYFWKKKK